MAELEQLKTSRGFPARPTKGSHARGESASVTEPENSVLDVLEQMAPMLSNTMSNAMTHGLSNMFDASADKIRVLEEKVDVLEAEADKPEQHSRRPYFRIQGIPG